MFKKAAVFGSGQPASVHTLHVLLVIKNHARLSCALVPGADGLNAEHSCAAGINNDIIFLRITEHSMPCNVLSNIFSFCIFYEGTSEPN